MSSSGVLFSTQKPRVNPLFIIKPSKFPEHYEYTKQIHVQIHRRGYTLDLSKSRDHNGDMQVWIDGWLTLDDLRKFVSDIKSGNGKLGAFNSRIWLEVRNNEEFVQCVPVDEDCVLEYKEPLAVNHLTQLHRLVKMIELEKLLVSPISCSVLLVKSLLFIPNWFRNCCYSRKIEKMRTLD